MRCVTSRRHRIRWRGANGSNRGHVGMHAADVRSGARRRFAVPGRGRQREALSVAVERRRTCVRRAAQTSRPFRRTRCEREVKRAVWCGTTCETTCRWGSWMVQCRAALRGLPEAVPLRRRPDRRSASGDVEGMRDASRLTLRHYASRLSVSNESFTFPGHAYTMFGSAR